MARVNESIETRLKRREDMFLRRMFGILAKMAKADGRVDPWETHAAEKAFDRFPRAAARRRFCAGVFNSAKNSRVSFDRLAAEFASEWASPEDCLAVYELLWDVACSKGVLKPSQKNLLQRACALLNLPVGYYNIFYRRRIQTFRECEEGHANGAGQGKKSGHERKSRSGSGGRSGQGQRSSPPPRKKTELEEAYELLGCCSSDSVDVLRRAYRAAAKRHHPDMLRARGCSERQVREAAEMMSRINAAWETICADRGL